MIAKLRGILDMIGDGFVVLDVNGVGYRVFCSSKTIGKLKVGQEASLQIEMQVREDHIHLFGFADLAEKKWFSLLTTVQGVGAKVGLAILSALSTDELAMAVYAADSKAFTKAGGVGPKLAVRIVTELKGKAVTNPDSDAIPDDSAGIAVSSNTAEDAISALTNFGFQRMDAASAVNKALKKLGKDADVSDIVREALKGFAS